MGQNNDDKKNLFIAMGLTVLIMLGYNHFFATKPPQVIAPQQNVPGQIPVTGGSGQVASVQTPEQATPQKPVEPLAPAPRVAIEAPNLKGSFSLRGAQFDDAVLPNYRETVDKKSPPIRVLNASESSKPYFTETGWMSPGKDVRVPDATTLWSADATTLTPEKPITLTWDNGQGYVFERVVSIDKNFLITIKQKVRNTTTNATKLQAFALIRRAGPPGESAGYMLHQGPIGYIADKLHEFDFDDLKKKLSIELKGVGGWFGITDKYWLVSFVPQQTASQSVTYRYHPLGNQEAYQVDSVSDTIDLPAAGEAEFTYHLFAGAKELRVLDAYEPQLNVPHFDLAIDFGYLYFLTKPTFKFLRWLNDWLGNFGLAILLLTVLVKLVLFPIANKSYRSMSRMKRLQPKIQELQKRHANDAMRLSQEVMALYKREGASPFGGCLPMLAQFPIFFALYKVLFITIEMRHAPFFGWIHDLSAPDPTSPFNLFGLLPFAAPSFLQIGLWPMLMGATMYIQQKLNPPAADPTQQKVFAFMPVLFTFMMAQFPSGLVIYWAWQNILSIMQQWLIMRMEEKSRK